MPTAKGEVPDLSSGQFVEGEVVTGARTIERLSDVPRHGGDGYLLLRARVERLLAAEGLRAG